MTISVAAFSAATLIAACASGTESSGSEPSIATAPSPTEAPTTSSAPSTTAPATTSTTSATPTSTTSTSTTSTTSSTTTTLVPPIGGYACVIGTQGPAIWEVRPPSDIPSPEVPAEWRRAEVGQSIQGRPIEVFVRPVESARRRVVVIGGIHGNEPATPPVVRGFLEADIPDDVEVWLVPESNPDGVAAGTRCNANGVDLNRSFPWAWRPDDGGPAPMSEPETRAAASLVEGLRPDLVVWVHQPLDYVSSVGTTNDAYEVAWSVASGLPVRPDVSQHGGGESWSAFEVGVPSMLIEIDGWGATPEIVVAQRAGFEATLRVLD